MNDFHTAKNIKDYLHLYLGAPCFIGDDKIVHFIRMVNEIGLSVCTGTNAKGIQKWFKSSACLPILRKLSDMTEQEMNYIGNDLKAGTWNAPDIRSNPNMAWSIHHLTPEIFRYLLSQGFDLFSLIEAGLAIDKNSLDKKQFTPGQCSTLNYVTPSSSDIKNSLK